MIWILGTVLLSWLLPQTVASIAPINLALCRDMGYDPMQLACQTCQVLSHLPAHLNQCLACCQSYRDVSRRSHPHQAVVLVETTILDGERIPYRSSLTSHSELESLWRNKYEWDSLVQEKQGQVQLLKRRIDWRELSSSSSKAADAGDTDMLYYYYLRMIAGAGGPPAEAIFLDELLPVPPTTEKGLQLEYHELVKMASEIISLHGLSKDDILDMLRTLLP